MKEPFVTYEKLQEIVAKYPTPFHLYDEKGIREMQKQSKKRLHGIKVSVNILP